MKAKYKSIVKATLSIVVFILILNFVSSALVCPNDYRLYQWIGAFYENEENRIDAVYIGSSTVYAFWCPSLAWKKEGISVWNYTSPRQPLAAAKYIIEDCRKTQKDALYIVNLNRVTSELDTTAFHFLLDFMPASVNKHKLISELCDLMDIPLSERVEFYFPFELYHTRWSELTEEDFNYEPDGYMSSPCYNMILKKFYGKQRNEIRLTDEKTQIEDSQLAVLNDLLDYCESNDVNVLFTINPQITNDTERQREINYAKYVVEKRGFDVVDYYFDEFESIGFDTTQDFQNGGHTNIHGAIKMTSALSSYLADNYDFENKRGKTGYENWDVSVEKYTELISPYTLPFEYENAKRDGDVETPHFVGSEYDRICVSLEWGSSEDAEKYKLYRRIEDKKGNLSAYEEIAEIDADETEYTDFVMLKRDNASAFTYIVVPVYYHNGEVVFGNFDYEGITISDVDE